MAVPRVRPLFDGIERADSFVVDPHKWLFAPFDCAALLYREPSIARATHTQHAEYLDVVTEQPHWNPSDYAYHLSRRARGLPFWFSLATHGTAAYAAAVEIGIDLAEASARADPPTPITGAGGGARAVDRRVPAAGLEPRRLLRLERPHPRRRAWPSSSPHRGRGETVLRFCFVNPSTTIDDVELILDSMV